MISVVCGRIKKKESLKYFSMMPLRCFYTVILLSCFIVSCTRADKRTSVAGDEYAVVQPMEVPAAPLAKPLAAPQAPPLAIIQPGEHPLWFQFIDGMPVLIESIEDACFSAALIPWPLAPHVRFMIAQGSPFGEGEDLLMAVNREGFLYFASWKEENNAFQIGLYHGSGGDFWRHYTIGALLVYDKQPAALLYRDDRFLDSAEPLPSPRLWAFDRNTSRLQALIMPSLDAFAPDDGWDMDTLRRGADGFWYFRATQKIAAQPEIRMFRTDDLSREAASSNEVERVSLGTFQNSALPQHLSAAPGPLREMLAAAFAESGYGRAAVISPAFDSTAFFAADREKPVLYGYFSPMPENPFFLAITPQGNALYADTGSHIRHFTLPALPEGFFYTGIGVVGETVIASWEEQEEYSIGAAGFMMIKR